MMLVRVVVSAAVVGSVAGIANDTIGIESKYPGHNGCWNVRWDDAEMTDECCPLFDEECFGEFCSVPDGPFHHTCMHQLMEHYVEGEYVRARASCTVNVNTCEMTCPCDDMKHAAGHQRVHKMTTVDLGECTTFENCHGELTCTEDEFYEGCPVPPAPVEVSAAVVESVAGISNDTIGIESKYPGHNGCWNVRWDEAEMTDECCPLLDEECFSEFCSVPDGSFHRTCMHQLMEHYVEGEMVRERASCTVNVNTCEMTCPCDDMKHPVAHQKVHRMTTVDLGECTTFDNCHGELTCTEDEFYEGCPVPPAPVVI